MLVAFRVDAALHIGTGHLQRCLTLAKKLRQEGCNSIFFLRNFNGDSFYNLISDAAFEYRIIGNSEVCYPDLGWLGCTELEDAEAFISTASVSNFSLVIVDHYSISAEWECVVKEEMSVEIMVIDDLANRKHDCEFLLDQNYLPSYNNRYEKLTPNKVTVLLGPKYILLRDEFLTKNNVGNSYERPSILVNFGGVGSLDVWDVFLPAIIENAQYDYHIISGSMNDNDFDQLQARLQDIKNIKLDQQVDNMTAAMLASNFSIGACGSTVWERFCLGVNSCLVDVADNQKEIVNFLAKKGMVDYLGSLSEIDSNSVSIYLRRLDIKAKKYITRKSKIKELVDGYGAQRVTMELLKYMRSK